MNEEQIEVETIYQGENLVSLGGSDFLAFSRDYNGVKLKCPQLIIKSFEYILEELARNGRGQLEPIYPESSTVFVLPRCTDEPTYLDRFKTAGIEALQVLGTTLY